MQQGEGKRSQRGAAAREELQTTSLGLAGRDACGNRSWSRRVQTGPAALPAFHILSFGVSFHQMGGLAGAP